jgi:hypothetical protein
MIHLRSLPNSIQVSYWEVIFLSFFPPDLKRAFEYASIKVTHQDFMLGSSLDCIQKTRRFVRPGALPLLSFLRSARVVPEAVYGLLSRWQIGCLPSFHFHTPSSQTPVKETLRKVRLLDSRTWSSSACDYPFIRLDSNFLRNLLSKLIRLRITLSRRASWTIKDIEHFSEQPPFIN